MSKPIPAVQKYMTTSPHSIGFDQPLNKAHAMMNDYAIRHLPVLKGGAIVGLLSERDLSLIESLKDVNAAQVSVEDAMSNMVFTVAPNSPLDEVVGTMASKKFGCAVVMENQRVVGIFTSVDVCRALADLLHTRLTK